MTEEIIEKVEIYLRYLNEKYSDEYKFTCSSDGLRNGKVNLNITLTLDCEFYVKGDYHRDELIDVLNDEPINDYGFDTQYIQINVINKDKFFNKYIIQLKEYLKKSLIGDDIKSVNFYRRKGSEIYPPEVSIAIKPKILTTEWIHASVELKSELTKYRIKNGLRNLDFITPMSYY
jgi:hypothetical protein